MVDLSIIICSYNRCQSLHKTLEVLHRSIALYPGTWEIVVADNGSTDDTAGVTEKHGARRVWTAQPNKSLALNEAVAQTETEYLLFMDDDIIVEPEWVQKMVEPLENGGHGVVGRIVVPEERRLPWMNVYHLALMAHTNHYVHGVGDLVGGAMGIHRRVFATIPSFDPEVGPGGLGYGEDTLFSAQMKSARMKIAYAQQATCYHYCDPDRFCRKGFLERAISQGQSQAYLHYHWLHEDWSLDECAQTVSELGPLVDEARLITEKSPQAPAPPEEIDLHNRYGRALQYPIEAKRERVYHKRGLQKISSY
jgi:glycosyltransferase involved in cell wall biosynthesis